MNTPVVLISGATGALGKSAARNFAAAGYKLALMHHQDLAEKESLQRDLIDQISEEDTRWYTGSLKNKSAVKDFFRQVKKDLGPVTVCIHCAGNMIRKLLVNL